MSETSFNFEELISLTVESKENKNKLFNERLMKARSDAILHITENAYQKMKESATKGYSSSTLYSFSWVKDPNAKVDNNGVKTVFDGDIRLLDLITKDAENFFNELNYHFNRDNENKFHCGFNKNGNTWNIFVSWNPNPIKETMNQKQNFNKKYIKKPKNSSNNI